jgi:hydroxyethylthiazole kinase
MFNQVFKNVKIKKPLVHNITNYVTVNDCANILLANGASPIMADDVKEVEEIVSICNGLVINIGTLNERTIDSMLKAGKKANELNIPVILDPVGAGASSFRTQTVYRLLDEVKFAVIRGNISEIKTVNDGVGSTKGVDADEEDVIKYDNIQSAISLAQKLSSKTEAIIAITGETDVVANTKKAYIIKNGHAAMSRVTGTGCMLTAVIGSYCAANVGDYLEATACAIAAMGLAGERAYGKVQKYELGTGSLRTFIIDEISNMSYETLTGGMKVELLS